MRKTINPQPNLREPWLELEHARELETISSLLDAHPKLNELVLQDLKSVTPSAGSDVGRGGMSAEQVLRALLVKQLNQFSYRELAFHLADSRSYRTFCQLGIIEPTPSKSTLPSTLILDAPVSLALARCFAACICRLDSSSVWASRASTASRASFRNSSTRGLLRNLSDEAFARTFVPSSMTRSSVINPSALRSPKVCTNNSCRACAWVTRKSDSVCALIALHSGEPLIRRMMFAQPLNRTGRTHGLTAAVDPQAHQ